MIKKVISGAFCFLLFVLSISATNNGTMEINPKVDERTELICTVCRLAGFEEYTSASKGEYVKDVDSCFFSFRSHPVVLYAKNLNSEYRVAYDAWMNLAVHLEIKDGTLFFNPDLQLSKLVEYEKRWKEDTVKEFISKLNEFYKMSEFNNFFNEHTDYYKKLEEEYNKVLKPDHLKWVADAFKESPDKVQVVLGILNGKNGYGAKAVDIQGVVIPYMIVGEIE